MNIVVNGTRHDVPRVFIDYVTIAQLAGHPESKELTVTYHWRGAGDFERRGTLRPHEAVEGENGMIFNTVHTGAA